MIKYQAMFGDIKPVECNKETEQFVYIGKQRSAKRSDWCCYFDSKEEAVSWIIEKQVKAVDRAKSLVVLQEKELAKLLVKFRT